MIEKPTTPPCVITAKLSRYMEARRKVLMGYSNMHDRQRGFDSLFGVYSAWGLLADTGMYSAWEPYMYALSIPDKT